MRPPERTGWRVLVPYDVREGIAPGAAAAQAGKSQRTILLWCNQHGIGRRVGGGVWVVSKVALAMHLDGDTAALRLYLTGNRSSQTVVDYFRRCDVPLPASPAISAALTYQSDRPAVIVSGAKTDPVINGGH